MREREPLAYLSEEEAKQNRGWDRTTTATKNQNPRSDESSTATGAEARKQTTLKSSKLFTKPRQLSRLCKPRGGEKTTIISIHRKLASAAAPHPDETSPKIVGWRNKVTRRKKASVRTLGVRPPENVETKAKKQRSKASTR